MKKLVIIPGGFHPFHAGHKALYDAAVAEFPSADVYIAASDSRSERPFPFKIKKALAQMSGVPAHRFIQVKSPFGPTEITDHYDPNETQLIFVKSTKNSKTGPDPEGPFPVEPDPQTGKLPVVTRGPRKGQPVSDWLQYYKRNNLQPMSHHGYLKYLPVKEFSGMTSGSEIRAKWINYDQDTKRQLVNIMYPRTVNDEKLTDVAVKLIDTGLGVSDQPKDQPKENVPGGGTLQGAPMGGIVSMTHMPNGPRSVKEDPTQDEPMQPTYVPGGDSHMSAGSVDDVSEQVEPLDPMMRRRMLRKVLKAGKNFIEHLQAMPDHELKALYQELPEIQKLMQSLRVQVDQALKNKIQPKNQQKSDYISEF